MGKRVPQVNEAASALQSDTAAQAAASQSQEKGLRSKEVKRTGKDGDLVPPVTGHQPEGDNVSQKQGGLFERIKDRLKKGVAPEEKIDPDQAAAEAFIKKNADARPERDGFRERESARSRDEDHDAPPRKGDLARAIRLEAGRDKLLVNQRKITDKVRKILLAIEAQDTYLKSIALKVVSRKHQGVVIDLPKRQSEDDELTSHHKGPLAKLLGKKPKNDD